MTEKLRLLRKPQVLELTGLSGSELKRAITRKEFPQGVLLTNGGRAVAWPEEEVLAWREKRMATARVEHKWADAEKKTNRRARSKVGA